MCAIKCKYIHNKENIERIHIFETLSYIILKIEQHIDYYFMEIQMNFWNQCDWVLEFDCNQHF